MRIVSPEVVQMLRASGSSEKLYEVRVDDAELSSGWGKKIRMLCCRRAPQSSSQTTRTSPASTTCASHPLAGTIMLSAAIKYTVW